MLLPLLTQNLQGYDVNLGFAQFDALAKQIQVSVGFAQFDATAVKLDVNVGFAQFDATATPLQVNVGFAQFDSLSPKVGGGYDDNKKRKKVIIDGKLRNVTPYELDQLLDLKTELAKEAEQETALAIAFAKAKPIRQVTKPLKVVIEYDDDADIEELLMML